MKLKIFTFNPMQENTYLVYTDTGEAMVIDPGMYTETEEKMFFGYLEENKLCVRKILLTHAHLDHVFGLKRIVEKSGITPKMSSYEQPVFDNIPAACLRWQMKMDHYTGAIDYIEAGDTLRFGTHTIDVLHTPGHSPGSLSFYFPKATTVFSGDALFKRSIGRTDLEYGDHETLLTSIREKLFALPAETQVYAGHGAKTTIAYEKIHNPFVGHNA